MKSKHKLKNQSGASFIIALLFFLICSTVGASVLMAAKANSSRLVYQKKTEQAFLTVRSAAMLISDTLSGESQQVAVHTVTQTTSSDGSVSTDESWSKKYDPSSASLSHKVDDSVYSMLTGNGTASAFSVTVSKDGLEDTAADIKIAKKDNSFALNSAVALKDGENKNYNYKLSVSMTGTITKNETSSTYTEGENEITRTETVYILSWSKASFKNG